MAKWFTLKDSSSDSLPSMFLDLKKNLDSDIFCDRETLINYSYDKSPFQIMPMAVVFPESSNDIKEVISFARDNNMCVSPCGYKSGDKGSFLSLGIVVDMSKHFNKINNVDLINNTVTAQAGVKVSDLIKKLTDSGLSAPIFNQTYSESSLGGLISKGSPNTKEYGKISDWIEGLSIILDNGEEHKINSSSNLSGRLLSICENLNRERSRLLLKDLSGADISIPNIWTKKLGSREIIDLITGSEGSFGIITEVTLRVKKLENNPKIKISPFNLESVNNKIWLKDSKVISKNFLEKSVHSSFLALVTDVEFLLCEKDDGEVTDSHSVFINIEEKELFDLIHSKIDGGNILRGLSDISCVKTPLENTLSITRSLPMSYGFYLIYNLGKSSLSLYPINPDTSNRKTCSDKLLELNETLSKKEIILPVEGGLGKNKYKYLKDILGDTTITELKKIKNIFDPLNIFNSHY